MGRLTQIIMVIGLALLSTPGQADDQDRALQLRESGKILPLEEILSISRTQINGHVLEVELERKRSVLIYEIKILDDKGRVWELKVDATTGQIINREQE